MTVSGLRINIEIAVLALSAFILSFIITSQAISNTLLLFLLGIIFAVEGMAIDLSFLDHLNLRKNQLTHGILITVFIAPLAALLLELVAPNMYGILYAIAAAPAAIAASRIITNRAGGNGDHAAHIATISTLIAAITVPIVMWIAPFNFDFSLLASNAIIPVLGFVTGILLQRFESVPLNDLRIHFSKVVFWMITLIAGIQLNYLMAVESISYVYLILAVLAMTAFTALVHLLGLATGKFAGFYMKDSLAVASASSIRNPGVVLLIAVQLGPEAIFLAALYYYVSIATNLFISWMDRIELKQFDY